MANGFCHVELNTGDVAAAKGFYARLFDWKLTDMPMGPMTYTMLDAGKGQIGGGMQVKPMPDAPPAWLPYVEVKSVQATIAKAKDAGATIVLDYMAIPPTGAIGIFVDPAGAMLGLWEPPLQPVAAAPAKAKTAAKPKAKAKPAAKAKAKAKPKAKAKRK